MDAGLGITTGTQEQVNSQWEADHEGFRKECEKQMRHLKGEIGITARILLVKGALAAKIPYKAAVQVATHADGILWKTQQVLNDCVLGGTKGGRTEAITNELAYQSREEGGLGHIHLMSRMKAEWASLVGTLHDNKEPWRILWWERLREMYGPLAEPGLERSTCAFKKCADMRDASELQRRAMEAWGSLPPITSRMEQDRSILQR